MLTRHDRIKTKTMGSSLINPIILDVLRNMKFNDNKAEHVQTYKPRANAVIHNSKMTRVKSLLLSSKK